MAGTVSQWAESEMDAVKIQALAAAEKIPEKILVKWFAAAGHHWPSGEDEKIPVFQAYYECGLRLPAHPFLTLVLEHWGFQQIFSSSSTIMEWIDKLVLPEVVVLDMKKVRNIRLIHI